MATLKSRKITIELDAINKINITPDDVVVVQTDLLSLNPQQAQGWADAIRAGFERVFPNNKVIVLDKSVVINIVTITP